jgi:protein-L-isoaspartate(D-aspartate) O-methyltransferase
MPTEPQPAPKTNPAGPWTFLKDNEPGDAVLVDPAQACKVPSPLRDELLRRVASAGFHPDPDGSFVMGWRASKDNRFNKDDAFASMRARMVEHQIAARGVQDALVLAAMRKVPRELFLPKNLREFAYEDSPLPIAGGQTISQPYIVAFMAEALMLKGGEKVLEIGAGSGYAAAVLSQIAAQVYTVERLGQLAEQAAATLAHLGYVNVHVRHGDGTKGWAEHAPYDAIVVAAGGPQVPQSLKEQLKTGGRLVMPVGAEQRTQELFRLTRVSAGDYRSENIADVRFVPLIGDEGWLADG